MPTLDLTPAALAAQARELVVAWDVYDAGGRHDLDKIALRIAAALGAVCDAARAEAAAKCPTHNRALTRCFYCVSAAEIEGKETGRAERAEEVRQLREAAEAVSLSVQVAPKTILGVPLESVVIVDREKMQALQVALAKRAATESSYG